MEKYDYFWARAAVQITGIVFFTQLLFEVSGLATRKPEMWWVIWACGAAFAGALIYSTALIALNARKSSNAELRGVSAHEVNNGK